MSLLDIIGPVMIGPSSSHTAGAVRIGMMARRLWGWERPLRSAKLFLRGSFAATYWGHGTDRGLVAGLLRMQPDDLRIPDRLRSPARRGWIFLSTRKRSTARIPIRCASSCRTARNSARPWARPSAAAR